MTITIICISIGVVLIIAAATSSSDEEHKGFGDLSDHLSSYSNGYALAGGLKATNLDTAYKNALIVGQSGSGKTSTVLVGSTFTLARGKASLCSMDVSGEIHKLTSGYLAKHGFNIHCIDFGPNSDGFNVFDLCRVPTDAQKVAHTIIKNSGVESKSDMYWSASAEMLLSVFMQYLILHAEPKYRSMANVVRLVETFSAEPQKTDRLFVSAKDEKLLASYKAVNAAGERTLQSTVSMALTALKIFKSPAVARCTAMSTFDFSSFRKEKTVLYICTPLNEVSFMAPISALLFESLFKEILSRIPDKSENSIFCLLDEMVTMKFQNLGLVYSNCRKYRAGCMGLVQDERMLEMNYSPAEAHAIRTNSFSKVYLKGQPLATCKMLEETLGRCAVKDERGIERMKPLMEASEIRMSSEAIILCGSSLPLKAKMTPFFDHYVLNSRTKIPPYQSERKIPFDEPPLIPLD